jgi:hypothetical protein
MLFRFSSETCLHRDSSMQKERKKMVRFTKERKNLFEINNHSTITSLVGGGKNTEAL